MKFPLAVAVLVSTVTAVSTCNPLTQSNCPADPGLGILFRQDFDNDAGDHFEVLKKPGKVTFDLQNGVSLTMDKRGDNPTIQLNFYIMFGKVEVVLKAAKGTGVITSFYLQSDDLDEIDIELFGGDAYEFQSNYFIKGNTKTYDRGQYHPTLLSPLDNYHTYTIEWNPDVLTWSLDGNVVRTLTKDNPQGFPQTPMQLIAGVWAGGDPDNAPGTIEWAGGQTDFSLAPFSMNIKLVVVADYSLGSKYSYLDQLGTWQSIKAENGGVNDRESQANEEFTKLQQGGQIQSSAKPLSLQPLESQGQAQSSEQLLSLLTQNLDEQLSLQLSLQLSQGLILQLSLQLSQSSSQSSSLENFSSGTSQGDLSGSVFILTGSSLGGSSSADSSPGSSSDDGEIVGVSTVGLVDPTAYVTPGFAGQQGAQTQGQIQTLTTASIVTGGLSPTSGSNGDQGSSNLQLTKPSGVESNLPSASVVPMNNQGSLVSSSSLISILILIASQLIV